MVTLRAKSGARVAAAARERARNERETERKQEAKTAVAEGRRRGRSDFGDGEEMGKRAEEVARDEDGRREQR